MTLAEDMAAPGHIASRLVLITSLQSRGEGSRSPQVQPLLEEEEGSCPQSLCRSLGWGWRQESSSWDFTSTVLGKCCPELPTPAVVVQLRSLLISGEQMVILV